MEEVLLESEQIAPVNNAFKQKEEEEEEEDWDKEIAKVNSKCGQYVCCALLLLEIASDLPTKLYLLHLVDLSVFYCFIQNS